MLGFGSTEMYPTIKLSIRVQECIQENLYGPHLLNSASCVSAAFFLFFLEFFYLLYQLGYCPITFISSLCPERGTEGILGKGQEFFWIGNLE